ESIERICANYGQTPSALELPSRRVFCWLKFLASGEQLATHLDALNRTRDIALRPPLAPEKPLTLHMVSLNHLWRRRDYHNSTLLKVHIGYHNADQQVWRSLLQSSLGRATSATEQNYREFAASEDFNESLLELESFA